MESHHTPDDGRPVADDVALNAYKLDCTLPSSDPMATTGATGATGGYNKKETVLDLSKFIDKSVRVKLAGGREVTGVLKGYDQLMNLVLDETVEYLRDPEDPLRITDNTRTLGLTVNRGTAVMVVSPSDGTDEIANPFLQQEA